MSVLIFANGQLNDPRWALPYVKNATAVIAADGGIHHLVTLRHYPDIVVGDMDSIDPELLGDLRSRVPEILVSKADKDETDLELALFYAVEHFQGEILIFGALGGRLDQTIANILLLTHPILRGRSVRLIEKQQHAWLVDRVTKIEGKMGDIVSLVPLDDQVYVDHTVGLKWALKDERLAFGPARGVSNIMTEPTATVSIHSGLLLCVHLFTG